jgi:hypothetical protein
MKVVIKFYPATFSFNVDEELPPFNPGCEIRQEILLHELYEQEIDSYSHAYEDYYISRVIKTKTGEEWVLGS